MTIEALAEKHHLKVTRDECNDKVIQGSRGQLYVDGGKLCALWLEAHVNALKLAPLGGRQWVGDYELVPHGKANRRLRDAKVVGILPDQVTRAIRLTGCRVKRQVSEEERARLVARLAGNQTRKRGL